VNLFRKWNIYPASVIGHSSGEIAAAYAAGSITAHEAITIAYYRGISAKRCSGNGVMAAIGLGREAVAPFLTGDIVVACENSPESVTLSGERESMDGVCVQIKKTYPDTLVRSLKITVAYHSREFPARQVHIHSAHVL
jgi:acyl transferase domain-containing protein